MTKVKRNFKDSLFRMVFHGKEELLSLYNAVNGSSYTNADDLVDSLILAYLFHKRKNARPATAHFCMQNVRFPLYFQLFIFEIFF